MEFKPEVAEAIDAVEIYALIDPETDRVRYIGKANNAHKRLSGHIRDARRRRTPVYSWINSLLAKGRSPDVVVIDSIPRHDWRRAERHWITRARDRCAGLLNLADGGDEPKPNGEQRANAARCAVRARTENRKNRGRALEYKYKWVAGTLHRQFIEAGDLSGAYRLSFKARALGAIIPAIGAWANERLIGGR